ncbi:NF-kappa-B essential modulator-like [Saccostrea echinata]|uniref:NF-kappa-B essential modulator-like n=1 Tax=Saccostrea echinata TaxID=191078 RepID=UPI002A82DBEF|nr:NF-kappa-B essential modulator-like [Saccostrea echinata]
MATPITWAQEVVTCDLCNNPTQQFCNNCQVSLCGYCMNKHVEKNGCLTHGIVAYKDRISKLDFPECEFHKDQRCDAYCKQCDVPVCIKCVISFHNGHHFCGIQQIFQEKKIEIEKETREIESTIILTFKKKQREIETSMDISKEKFDVLKKECEKERKVWHNEVDSVFNKLSSLVESMKNHHLATLKSYLSNLQDLIKDIINTTQKNKINVKSNKVSDIIRHKSKMQKYRNIPTCVTMTIPSIETKREEGKEFVIELGYYRATLSQTVVSSLPERISDLSLKESQDRVRLDTTHMQGEVHSALVEKLRLSVKRYEDDLTAERKEHQNTKKAMIELKQSFQQQCSKYNLSENYEKVKSQSGYTEKEKQKLLDQISRLTAQVYAGKKEINSREEMLNKIQEENKKITEELHNVVPVLKAQAEIWKSDFNAEKFAKKRLHAEKTQLENDYKQLQLRNQQLLDEMENFSKRQFQEMHQRHSNPGYQHTLQQHLGMGPMGHNCTYQISKYLLQGITNQVRESGGTYSDGVSPAAVPGSTYQIHSQSKEAEKPNQIVCPLCNQDP